MRDSDCRHDWKPLMEAVEHADAALGREAWRLMMEWNQAGLLPMRGRADGVTRKFKRHWFDFPAKWGCGEPPLPPDESGTRPPVGPDRTTSRPSRSALAPSIAETIVAPSALRLHGSDDILWFDKSAATAKRKHVPDRVTNVIVDLAALRRLIRARQSAEADVAAPTVAMPPPVKPVSNEYIRWAIQEVYRHARQHGMKPQNVKEIAEPAQEILKCEGRHASLKHIETIAGESSFKNYRRPPGKRVNGTLRAFSLEGWKKSGVES